MALAHTSALEEARCQAMDGWAAYIKFQQDERNHLLTRAERDEFYRDHDFSQWLIDGIERRLW